jgi:hypothetical protein
MFAAIDTAVEPAYKYVTADDQRAFGEWFAPHVWAFCPVPTAPLYHYTSGAGLIEIIRSGELWATQLACLNDASELLYPMELLRNKVQAKLRNPLTDEIQFLLQKIDAGLTPQVATEGRFLSCFSEDGDDLSQWRGYGGGEGGYAIAFDAQHLRQLAHRGLILGKVEYDEQKQSLFLDEVLTQVVRFYLDGLKKRRALPPLRSGQRNFWTSGRSI